ncbi:MAG: bifunctional folylpolyglutamate synthase/dihydrofolate synthase [Ruminococcaceae bacterium]|nr:bifunctional folylpolyglutamate synthase/dihydrofolate synthase [Oscillospiraceae bacterium]
MNYTESIEYIHSISWCFCKPGLDRISHLCRALGDPQKELRFIHVAGTNGKGSFCAMLEAILRHAGYKTAMFTSPYIRSFNERICVDGAPISDEDLADVTSYVRPFADAMDEKPTEFELITAIGFEHFKRSGCDVVILEAGMGGRLDSTNIIDTSLLSVITGIALDHTAFLGDTVEKIAYEKAGIIKSGSPVLFGANDSVAEAVIREAAREKNSEFYMTDRAAISNLRASLDGTTFDFFDRKDIHISLLGLYQPLNAANVITAVDILNSRGLEISDSSLYEGLASAEWHARFELISKEPTVIYDGAHNPEGIHAAVESIKQYFPGNTVYILSGVMKDKDYESIASDLSEIASRAYTVTPNNPRALDAKEYADVLSKHRISALPFTSLATALKNALDDAKKDGVPLFCMGSLYMYSELMEAFETIEHKSEI